MQAKRDQVLRLAQPSQKRLRRKGCKQDWHCVGGFAEIRGLIQGVLIVSQDHRVLFFVLGPVFLKTPLFRSEACWYSCDMLMPLMVCGLLLPCSDGSAGGILDVWFTMFTMQVSGLPDL